MLIKHSEKHSRNGVKRTKKDANCIWKSGNRHTKNILPLIKKNTEKEKERTDGNFDFVYYISVVGCFWLNFCLALDIKKITDIIISNSQYKGRILLW